CKSTHRKKKQAMKLYNIRPMIISLQALGPDPNSLESHVSLQEARRKNFAHKLWRRYPDPMLSKGPEFVSPSDEEKTENQWRRELLRSQLWRLL
ncbi:hypothetical protein Tco_0910573, partial [Tanacetum coccineum]